MAKKKKSQYKKGKSRVLAKRRVRKSPARSKVRGRGYA